MIIDQLKKIWSFQGSWFHNSLLTLFFTACIVYSCFMLGKWARNAYVYMKTDDYKWQKVIISFVKLIGVSAVLFVLGICLTSLFLLYPEIFGTLIVVLFLLAGILYVDTFRKKRLLKKDPETKLYTGKLLDYERAIGYGSGTDSESVRLFVQIDLSDEEAKKISVVSSLSMVAISKLNQVQTVEVYYSEKLDKALLAESNFTNGTFR